MYNTNMAKNKKSVSKTDNGHQIKKWTEFREDL